jgi:hypothetical protein
MSEEEAAPVNGEAEAAQNGAAPKGGSAGPLSSVREPILYTEILASQRLYIYPTK